MSKELEMHDIIADFNNDKKTTSSYSISSEEEASTSLSNSDKIQTTILMCNKKDDEFLFYNNDNSNSECKEEDSTEIDSKILEKTYFTSTELGSKKYEIIKLFYMFDVIILTDDYRIKLISKTGCFCWFKSKKYINPEEFPGILFLSFNSVNLIKKCLRKHNNDLLNSESETCHKFKYQICFDEGDIYKNMVYKKIQIQDKLLFVPMSKYQLKITEYKLRGFCQIMEELGANEIEIEFNNGQIEKSSSKVEINTSEYTYIAGSLGFTASSNKTDKENITYKLIYPENNTFILNSKVIKKKILAGKYIISKKNFDSNLELQYIIDSRCRHFITNYSTVFTLDNSISYDHKLIGKLEANKFNLGFETSDNMIKNLKVSINTKVKFCDQSASYKNLLGDNVSWDSIGFNYLLGTLKEETFKEEGIYKIIFFIHKYIDKVIHHKNKEYYYQIKKIYRNMNKEFSFLEYRDLLLEYFSISSHWLHFLNFIDVLVFRSVSYDKLGFLVLMSQTNLSPFKKNLKIINFIKHISTRENIEEQFWEMLEPNKYYLAVSKLDKCYDILNKFNWFNLERLIYDLKKYKPRNNDLNYENLYLNFTLGHTFSQFDKNIKPFLIKFINKYFNERVKSLEPSLSGIIFNTIRPRHIIYYNINSEEKLKQLIDNKLSQIEEGQMFFVEVFDKIKDYNINQILDSSSNLYVDLFPITQSDKFKNKYSYIYRKLSYILEDYSNIDSLVSFCIESNIHSSMRSFALNLIKKVILFDYKFNIDSVDLNYLGFNYILLQIKNTNQVKFNYLKNEFFINLCYFIIKEKTQHVDKNVLKISNLEEDILKDIKECINFYILVDIACNYLNKKFNLNLESEFYRLLKN